MAIPKSELNKRLYAQRKESGLVKREVWVKPDDLKTLLALFPEWPVINLPEDVGWPCLNFSASIARTSCAIDPACRAKRS